MIYQIVISLLLIGFGIYLFKSRQMLKQLADLAIIWQQTATKKQDELRILTEQYRQLANINQALRNVYESKGLIKAKVKGLKRK